MKKIIISTILVLTLLISSIGVFAFNFPEPDWGQLLNEKRAMIGETDFELYVEAAPSLAPYYGAKFEPRSGAYLGMIAENTDQFSPLSGYLTYIQHMYQDDLYVSNMVRENNVITMVGWTIDDLYSIDYGKIRSVLETLNAYNKPMFIRFANEMNVSPLGDEPDKYVEVFRRVADMIHEYPNLAVVWSPNDMGALDRPFEYFYPGDEYVDWIGVSCYSIKYFQGRKDTLEKESAYFMTGDYAWATNRVKPIIEFMEKNNINKPLMVSEGGVPTNNHHGDNLESWATPRLRNMLYYLVMKYPQIKMVNYFNTHRGDEAERFDISNYPYAVDIFNEARTSGIYQTTYGKEVAFSLQPANNSGTLYANNNIVRVHTLAHFPGNENIIVNYSIDGTWYDMSGNIPYTCNINTSQLSDGNHTLTISTLGEEKSYPFYKIGNAITFGYNMEIPEKAPETEKITVKVNGNTVQFDQQPIIENGRTLVPLRAIFEALGADVQWDAPTQTVIATRFGKKIKLTIDSSVMYVDGAENFLDVPAKLVNSRTLVPVRAIGEAFGCNVNWVDSSKTVEINE